MELRQKEKVMLIDAVDEWLTDFKKNSVKPATYDRLLVSYKLFKRARIGYFDIESLRCIDIQKYVNELASQGYSSSTVKKQYMLLSAFLRHAFSQGMISSPVYLGVRVPNQTAILKPIKQIETYSPLEQRKLMRILSTLEHKSYAVDILMLEAGLRVGEALSLTWDDVQWDRRALVINKTLVRLSTQKGLTFVQNGAKSKSSNRIVPLSKIAVDALSRIAELSVDQQGYIFTNDDNPSVPFSYYTVRYHLDRACEKVSIPCRGCHAFRHTFATNCYNKGCDVKILSKLLGHADVSITYNIYIHLFGDALEEMRKVIE